MTTCLQIRCLFLLACLAVCHAATSSFPLEIPAAPPSSHAVPPNFLGLSFELSFVDEYFGNDTQHIPQPFINYINSLRTRIGQAYPFRARIGGNSVDTSVYNASQLSPMLLLLPRHANADNQPVMYGPLLWDVLEQTSQNVQGIQFLLGLSLPDPNDPTMPILARDSQTKLGDSLDAFLLGNEPDLYTDHLLKPDVTNYTLDDYLTDFSTATSHLTGIFQDPFLGGPTICCHWDLAPVLQAGYVSEFHSFLKYVSIQHYPQNNCFGTYPYDITYYQQHSNTVAFAAWQQPGIDIAVPQIQMLMSEFNSVSCGGVPGLSDTFVVGSMWTADYVLQLAAIGYSGAYMHTRERGIPYNAFDSPADGVGPWTTNPTFYAHLVVGEILQSPNTSIVVDLNIPSSTVGANATAAGYSVYDPMSRSVRRLVLFNYANETAARFLIPANTFQGDSGKNVTVKFLSSASPVEKWKISWDGLTYDGVGDGLLVPVQNNSWSAPSQYMDCESGCEVDVPAPGLAVVFAQTTAISSTPHANGGRKISVSWTMNVAFAGAWILFATIC